MIHESYYWKVELYNCYLTLAKFRNLKRVTNQSEVKAEKALMIGAYIIRKLNDAQKIPPNFLLKKEILLISKNNGTTVDHMNWHRFETNYDFNFDLKEEKDWRFIINQIIHSFSFIFSFDTTDKLEGFLFNSDKTKHENLYFVTLETILRMFLSVSEGDITAYQSRTDSKVVDGKLIYGEMKLINAIYSYPENFDINTIISKTLKGKIYKRLNS